MIVGVNHPFIALPAPAKPTLLLLQYYYTTIAQYTPAHIPTLACLFMPYTVLIQYWYWYWRWQYRVKANLVGPTWDVFCTFWDVESVSKIVLTARICDSSARVDLVRAHELVFSHSAGAANVIVQCLYKSVICCMLSSTLISHFSRKLG